MTEENFKGKSIVITGASSGIGKALALRLADEGAWLTLFPVEDDQFPPHLDRRGRYFGCVIPDEGEQTCRVLVDLNDTMLLV